MTDSVDPATARELLATTSITLIDVREPFEFATGHLPSARNLPLAELRKDPNGLIPQGDVLFVCARGVRSRTAADLAESIGRTKVRHLKGGTEAWSRAGFLLDGAPSPSSRAATPANPETAPEAAPVATPETTLAASPEATPDFAPEPAPEHPSRPASVCRIPEPSLDAVVGKNLRTLRQARNVSLDELARVTALSRTLLGQIENGRAAPSVTAVWQIARALDVPFSALLNAPGPQTTTVLRADDARRLRSPDGRFTSRALFPMTDPPSAEFYEVNLAAHSREDALPHAPGTQENLVVASGALTLVVDGQQYMLAEGDAITFTADTPHAYINPGATACRLYLVITYHQP